MKIHVAQVCVLRRMKANGNSGRVAGSDLEIYVHYQSKDLKVLNDYAKVFVAISDGLKAIK